MIKEILNDLTDKIGYFDTIPLTEEIEGKRMVYKGRSEYKVIDIEKGGAFWVLTDMEQTTVEGIGVKEDIERTYTMELHMNIKRKDLSCDDEYAFDRVTNDVIGKIQMRDRVLAKSIGIQYIDTEVDEVSGEGGYMSKHYLFIKFIINVQTKFSKSCLSTLC